MKKIFLSALLVCAALSVAGCQNNFVVVGASGARNTMASNVALPCFLSTQEKATYGIVIGPRLTQSANVIPEQAKAARVDGCAGARFRVDAAGMPVDVLAIKEYPPGYGFGDAITKSILASRFEVPPDTSKWYYSSTAYTFAK